MKGRNHTISIGTEKVLTKFDIHVQKKFLTKWVQRERNST